jgi:hypothetical protein
MPFYEEIENTIRDHAGDEKTVPKTAPKTDQSTKLTFYEQFAVVSSITCKHVSSVKTGLSAAIQGH